MPAAGSECGRESVRPLSGQLPLEQTPQVTSNEVAEVPGTQVCLLATVQVGPSPPPVPRHPGAQRFLVAP